MSFSKMCLHFKAAFSLKLPTQTVIEQNLHFLIVSIIACLFLLYRHLVFIVEEPLNTTQHFRVITDWVWS